MKKAELRRLVRNAERENGRAAKAAEAAATAWRGVGEKLIDGITVKQAVTLGIVSPRELERVKRLSDRAEALHGGAREAEALANAALREWEEGR